jgi:hypothetical protein
VFFFYVRERERERERERDGGEKGGLYRSSGVSSDFTIAA